MEFCTHRFTPIYGFGTNAMQNVCAVRAEKGLEALEKEI